MSELNALQVTVKLAEIASAPVAGLNVLQTTLKFAKIDFTPIAHTGGGKISMPKRKLRTIFLWCGEQSPRTRGAGGEAALQNKIKNFPLPFGKGAGGWGKGFVRMNLQRVCKQ